MYRFEHLKICIFFDLDNTLKLALRNNPVFLCWRKQNFNSISFTIALRK